MATKILTLQAATQADAESIVSGYIAQGFHIANRTAAAITLMKRKEFSYFWAVIGFIFCLLPLVIYLIVYALENDQMVIINLAGAQPGSAYGAAVMTSQLSAPRSPDGNYWWDGQQWQPLTGGMSGSQYQALPAAAPSRPLINPSVPLGNAEPPRSPDGNYWWDGQQWQPVNMPQATDADEPNTWSSPG